MVMYYPHTFTAQAANEGQQNESGDWGLEETEPTSVVGFCRYEPSGGHHSERIVVDGIEVIPTGIVYFGVDQTGIERGQTITIVSDGTTLVSAKIVQFSKGLFNCRAWL